MFLSKFKKLKQKNKLLFNKAMKKSSDKSGCNEEREDSMGRSESAESATKNGVGGQTNEDDQKQDDSLERASAE